MDTTVQSKYIRLSAAITLYYDMEKEVLYMLNDVVYKYSYVSPSIWSALSGGDREFIFDTLATLPYKIVPKLPKDYSSLYSVEVSEPLITMYKVDSSNVAYVGYDSKKKRLYVEFLTGDVYEYYDVEEEIWNGLQKADSKGSYLHWFVVISDYRYDKVSGYGLDYSGEVMKPNAGEPHKDGYMVLK